MACNRIPVAELQRLCARKADCLEQIMNSLPAHWPRDIAFSLAEIGEACRRTLAVDVFRTLTVDILKRIQERTRGVDCNDQILDALTEAVFSPRKEAGDDTSRLQAALYQWLSKSTTLTLVASTQARRLSAYINTHLKDRLTLSVLSRVSGWSSASLDRVFRDQVGVSIHEYIVRARISRAYEMLLLGEKASTAQAEVGYKNKTSFNTAFRRLTGTTPGKARLFSTRTPAEPVTKEMGRVQDVVNVGGAVISRTVGRLSRLTPS